MPQSIPAIKGLSLYGENRTCFEVGGDYFDYIPLGEDAVMLVVADVCGKGAGAALLMSNLQAGLKSIAHFNTQPQQIVTRLNSMVYENTSPYQFITLFVGILHGKSGMLQYVNAGHTPGLLLDSRGPVQQLSRTGIGLGIRANSTFTERQVTLAPGSLLVLYSDGLEESFNENQEIYGVDRIIQTLQTNKENTPRQITAKLLKEIDTFAGSEPQADDLTLIIAQSQSQ